MTIPLSQVKTLCNANEVTLVQASRRPQLSRLTLTEAKRLAVRARKHFDKWQDLSRNQSRTSQRTKGVPVVENRSTEKAQIFRDTLDALESQVAKLEAAGAKGQGGRSASPAKTERNRGHRAERADVRKAIRSTTKTSSTAAKQAPTTAAETSKSEPAAGKKPATPRRVGKLTPPPTAKPKPGTAPATAGIQPKQQLRARTVAKEKRIAVSGKSNRVLGHTSAQGRRSQGRKDSR